MDDVGAMYRFDGAEDLVNKILDESNNHQNTHQVSGATRVHLTMIISKMLRPYDTVQVGLHEFLYDFLELNRHGRWSECTHSILP